MRRTARAIITLGTAFAFLLGADGTMLFAQAAAPPAAAAEEAAGTFSKDQLEQLVAPIALYPDALLAQIFMAATYPLEIVEAERFITANASLKGTALDEKLKEYDWQAEVKALCLMPDVLKKMSENLDWTQDLGDAFLGQKSQLMDTVQVMRNKAYDSGNLKSNEQQTIKVENTVNVQPASGAAAPPSGSDGDQIIVIQSTSPEVVYVPQYAPTAVYPGWSYPSYYYPPMYPYYPPGAGLVTFGVGMAVGAAIWGDCNWGGGWGHADVDIDVNRNNNFNRNTSINGGNRASTTGARGGKQSFQHNAAGRKGVNYGNSKVAGQYGGGQGGQNRVSQSQARGKSGQATAAREARTPREGGQGDRAQAGAGNRGQAGTGDRQGSAQAGTRDRQSQAGAGDRQGSAQAGTRDRQGSGQASAAAKDRAGSADRASAGGQRSSGASTRSSGGSSGRSAYSGSSKPSYDRASSSRGSMSRGTTSYGGSRGGGGARAGGGGRRR